MLNLQQDDIKTEAEFEKENQVILSAIKTKTKKSARMKSEGIMRFGLKDVQQATQDGVVIIDKVCILSYPLDHPRTGPVLKALYLAQEDLMMLPEEVEEAQLSSPIKDIGQDWTAVVIGALKIIPQKTLDEIKAANYAYLHKVYPELDS